MLRRILALLVCASPLLAAEEIRLPGAPALSPDGATLVFAWRGDLWRAPSRGGVAERVTVHPADDRSPSISPDGRWLAFVSERTGSPQVWLMPATGGTPRRLTTNTEGASVEGWFPDSGALLIRAARDHFWRDPPRFFLKRLDADARAVLLFDGYGASGSVSPDGRLLLFVREGTSWWRKGYRGSQAAQVWLYDTANRVFAKLSAGDHQERWPLWEPGGASFLVVSEEDGCNNLYRVDLATRRRTRLTSFTGDGVVAPALSADGSTLVFRKGPDLYRMDPRTGGAAERIPLTRGGEAVHPRERRDVLTSADSVAFTDDGREIAFAAGGDLWVMDTELKEPVRITDTPGEERDPVFSPDYSCLLFVSDTDGRCDLWKAERADPDRWWWNNDHFVLTRLTDDEEAESEPRFVPGGRVAFTNLRGDLWTMNPDGTDPRLVLRAWNTPSYDFSPDGRWVAYAVDDADFNRDVWIAPVDGSRAPVNVSEHPDWEGDPVWSPDGRMLAFLGRRAREESDIHYVWLRREDDEASRRDRLLEKAVEKMKGRPAPKPAAEPKPAPAPVQEPPKPEAGPAKPEEKEAAKPKEPEEPRLPEVVIDFDGIADRVRRIELPGVEEEDLLWSPDGKQLAFQAEIDGRRGIWTVAPPDEVAPKLLAAVRGSGARWPKPANRILWLQGGLPATLDAKGKAERFGVRAVQTVDLPARHRAAFDLCWRILRDTWYDARLNNLDWNAVRARYRPLAAQCVTAGELETVVDMMLGELNGSHLGFGARDDDAWKAEGWQPETVHFGARFDDHDAGPGLRVRDVIPGTPAATTKGGIEPGERVLAVDGVPLDPLRDPWPAFTGVRDRDWHLDVRGVDGRVRAVTLRPISWRDARAKLYEEWIDTSRATVDRESGGRLGYLHVRMMGWPSFERFEAELYKVGHGRDGLVIDVRENGGGFTADHLLTALCQPVHAFTIARGGAPGYPQDRLVYARWSKPIVVLCNQNSFSNAEIFAHAIRTLGRGPLVGVPTAGGVISTGGTPIMGFAWLRLPFRGWFLRDSGEDMEGDGCVPDVVIWPQPEEWPRGTDRQLDAAVKLLIERLDEGGGERFPEPTYRSERPAAGAGSVSR